MATLIPNSFQHPNILIDKLDYFLTPEESKVLSKAVREILGWEDKIEERKAPISLTVFVEGKFKDGKRVAYGCGLSLQAVRNALASLNEFGILVKVGQPTQDGQWYWLQDNEAKIDWKGLKARRAKWDAANTQRTKKATKKSLQSRGVTSDVRGNVGRKDRVTSDVREEVTSDVNKETHETQEETQIAGDGKIPHTRDETYLPEAEDQMGWLLGGRDITDGEKILQRAGWDISDYSARQAMAVFLESSRLPPPSKREKKTRTDWVNSVEAHLEVYGLEVLQNLYPLVIADMRGKNLTISRPGSITNNMGAWWAENDGKAPEARTNVEWEWK